MMGLALLEHFINGSGYFRMVNSRYLGEWFSDFDEIKDVAIRRLRMLAAAHGEITRGADKLDCEEYVTRIVEVFLRAAQVSLPAENENIVEGVKSDNQPQLPTWAEVERNYLERILKTTNGNKTKAAEMSGIQISKFRRRLGAHNLS